MGLQVSSLLVQKPCQSSGFFCAFTAFDIHAEDRHHKRTTIDPLICNTDQYFTEQ